MLGDADHDLFRRERALPGFRTLLDEEAFREVLQRANPEVEVTSARLRYLRYKPETNCLAAYEVEAGGKFVRVQGKSWRRDDEAKLSKHGDPAAVVGEGGLRGVHLEEQGLVVGVFPWDAKLTSLPRWATAEERARFFQRRGRLLDLVCASGWTVLNYKPERRLVAKISWGDGRPVGVLKAHTASAFAAAYAAAGVIRGGDSYSVPRLLGRSQRHGAVVLAWQEGDGLDAILGMRDGPWNGFETVGAALCEFQSQPGVGLPVLRAADLAAELPGHAETIGWLHPALAERARVLAALLARRLVGAPADEGTVHGDFYAKQVLVGRGHLHFLDMDSACRGPRWLDGANFLAHLETGVIRGRFTMEVARAAADAFCAGYAGASENGWPPVLPGLVAARLFVQAVHFFRCREADWASGMTRVCERVEALLAHKSGVGVTLSRLPETIERSSRLERSGLETGDGAREVEAAEPRDASMPFLDRALDCAWMERRLRSDPAWAVPMKDHRLAAATIRRHKPGRRCLIEYRFESTVSGGGGFGWLGKVSARWKKGWSDRVARALWEAGLTDAASVAVPEPLGQIPELHLELQRRVSGESVIEHLDTDEGPKWAARCASAVMALHDCGVVVPRVHTLEDEVAVLRERLDSVKVSHADLADRVDEVMEGCERAAVGLAATGTTLIHRDFYPDQVLLDGDRTWLLDLDLCCMGDPCLDHGNFVAHLMEWAIRNPDRGNALQRCVEAYRQVVLRDQGPAACEALEVYTTLSLARHLQICLRIPERRPWLRSILETCQQRLDLGVTACGKGG